jgi:hypothetical protein
LIGSQALALVQLGESFAYPGHEFDFLGNIGQRSFIGDFLQQFLDDFFAAHGWSVTARNKPRKLSAAWC